MSTKTPNYQLNQWEPSDQFLRTDFNEDNAKIDAALSGKASASALTALTGRVSSAEAVIPKIAVGTYDGDDAETRTIRVGFTPKAVLVVSYNGLMRFSNGTYGGLAVTGAPAKVLTNDVVTIVSGGFRVAYNYNAEICTNRKSMSYHYLAIG